MKRIECGRECLFFVVCYFLSLYFPVDQNTRMNQGQMRGFRSIDTMSSGSSVVTDHSVGSRVKSVNRPREFDRQGRALQYVPRGNQSKRHMVERNVRSNGRSTFDQRGRDDGGARDCDLEEVMFDLENQRGRANVLRGVSVSKPGRVSKVPKRVPVAETRSSVKMSIMQGQLDAMSCKLDKFLGSVDGKDSSVLANHVEDSERSAVLLEQKGEAEPNANASESEEVGGLLCILCVFFFVCRIIVNYFGKVFIM